MGMTEDMMTELDLAQVLTDEINIQHAIISKATRRRNILEHFRTRLRLGVKVSVVEAEIRAAGEPVPGVDEEATR